MTRPGRRLQVAFESRETFEREYRANLSNGGVFVPTEESFELRELVQVELVLEFHHSALSLRGEVVHIVPPGMSDLGATPGVAVQFQGAAAEVRRRFEPLLEAPAEPASERPDSRRSSPRMPVRVPARIEGGAASVAGHTRDLSRSGVLVSVPGSALPIGESVRISLDDPATGRALEVEGRIAREVVTDDGTAAVAIEFGPPQAGQPELEGFVERVQSDHHARCLGGISGAIEELGAGTLLSTFGRAAPAGTLTLRRGEEEGLVGFEGGLLRYARTGGTTGLDALVRLLRWSAGRFEFHASLDPVEGVEAPLPLEGALLEASRQIDEGSPSGPGGFDPEACVRVIESAEENGPVPKVDRAILDLAGAGFRVGRMIDVIPEPDEEVVDALQALLDEGRIALER